MGRYGEQFPRRGGHIGVAYAAEPMAKESEIACHVA